MFKTHVKNSCELEVKVSKLLILQIFFSYTFIYKKTLK